MSTVPNRRDDLAAQREAEAAKTRRTRMIAVAAALVALALIIGGVVWSMQSTKKNQPTSSAAMSEQETKDLFAKAALSEDKAGFLVAGATPKEGAPTVSVISDAQCPICKIMEETLGGELVRLARSGDIRLEFRPVAFLDGRLGNDSSHRATEALACAAGVGRYAEYNSALFANQPEHEGAGFTDEQLTSTVPAAAKITGDDLSRLQHCYAGHHLADTVNQIDMSNLKVLQTAGGRGTPTLLVNGKQLEWSTFVSDDAKTGKYVGHPEKLLEGIKGVK